MSNSTALADQLQHQRERLAALEGQRSTLREEAEDLAEKRLQLAPLAHVDGDARAQKELKRAAARISEIDGEVTELIIAIEDLKKRITRTEAERETARRQGIAREILTMLDAHAADGQAFEDACAAAAAALSRIEARSKDMNGKARAIGPEYVNSFSSRGLSAHLSRRLYAHFKPYDVVELIAPLSGRGLGELLTDSRHTFEKMAD